MDIKTVLVELRWPVICFSRSLNRFLGSPAAMSFVLASSTVQPPKVGGSKLGRNSYQLSIRLTHSIDVLTSRAWLSPTIFTESNFSCALSGNCFLIGL